MEPSLVVVQTMFSLIWIIVGVLLIILIIFAIMALVHLIGILKSTGKMVRQVEQKTTLVNNFVDQYLGLILKKITSFFSGKKTDQTQES